MKTVLSSRRHHYVAGVGIFLIVVALVVGMAACGGGGAVEYNLTTASTAGGSVTTPGEAGPYTYDEGEVVNLEATPDACYQFVNWTGDTGTIADVNAASTTITMNGDYSITANFGEEEAVTFPDPNLEAAIREAIGKPAGPLCPSDLGGLTDLWAKAKNITDLTGLEYCTSLTDLVVANNTISDISPLANLTSLTHLNLWDNQISDISPLANLTNLRVFYLGDNQISDISPVANLTNLEDLTFSNNSISDISVLANLTNLGHLNAIGNMISDISPLVDNEGLAQGDTVWLLGNPLSSDSINIYLPQLKARGVDTGSL